MFHIVWRRANGMIFHTSLSNYPTRAAADRALQAVSHFRNCNQIATVEPATHFDECQIPGCEGPHDSHV